VPPAAAITVAAVWALWQRAQRWPAVLRAAVVAVAGGDAFVAGGAAWSATDAAALQRPH